LLSVFFDLEHTHDLSYSVLILSRVWKPASRTEISWLTGFVEFMDNLESHGIYNFNFQARNVIEMQYAFGKQKGKKIKRNLKK